MMPEIVADQLLPSCYHLFPRPGILESQLLSPDLFLPRARHARAFRQGEFRQPARAVARHPQPQAAGARSCPVGSSQ